MSKPEEASEQASVRREMIWEREDHSFQPELMGFSGGVCRELTGGVKR